jgi:hypothetical protein
LFVAALLFPLAVFSVAVDIDKRRPQESVKKTMMMMTRKMLQFKFRTGGKACDFFGGNSSHTHTHTGPAGHPISAGYIRTLEKIVRAILQYVPTTRK